VHDLDAGLNAPPALSEKLTVPVGGLPEPFVVTVAVQLLGFPAVTELGEQATAVLVSGPTVALISAR
jgi:hypothetical protein